jgi:hypothetical protein
MSEHHPDQGQCAATRGASADEDLFGADAYDEMLESSCAAYVGSGEECSLTCAEHCAGEDELLRWARRYDDRVRAARDLAHAAACATALVALRLHAHLIGDWNPEAIDLSELLPHYHEEPL